MSLLKQLSSSTPMLNLLSDSPLVAAGGGGGGGGGGLANSWGDGKGNMPGRLPLSVRRSAGAPEESSARGGFRIVTQESQDSTGNICYCLQSFY